MAQERKVFSEQEVTAVVRRAVELQETAGQESYTPGVTATELGRIASELGIDPKYLQQAINESNSTESKKGPFHLTEEFERVVDTELKPEDYDILLKYLKPTNGRGGSWSQVGSTVSGSTWTGWSNANFQVTSKKGRTRVSIKSNALFAWLVSVHPATLASLVLLPSLASKGHAWLALAIVLPLLTVAGLAFKGLVARGHKAARELTERIAHAIAETGSDETPAALHDRLAPPSAEEPFANKSAL